MLQTLTTPRGETLSGTPWQVYPRPQMRRDSYINLNGEWDFAVSSGKPETFDMRITVPFCPESRLSGIGRHFEEGAPLWYRRRFLLPEGFRRERVLLPFSALTAGIRREVSLRLPYDEIRRVTVSEDLLNYRIAIETGEGAVTLTAQQKELSDLRTAGMLSFYSEGLLSVSSWHRENLDATLQALQALGA